MKKILMTGGSGFLAKRVGDYIAEDPGMIVLLPTHSELDITSKDSCRKWFEDNMPDMVIHLAAISDITECEKNEELSRSVRTGCYRTDRTRIGLANGGKYGPGYSGTG